jgi:hypothetical protein
VDLNESVESLYERHDDIVSSDDRKEAGSLSLISRRVTNRDRAKLRQLIAAASLRLDSMSNKYETPMKFSQRQSHCARMQHSGAKWRS